MDIDLSKTGIRAAGCWESYPNRVRAGLHQPDLPGHFEWEHSEAFVRGLAERGFNLFITQFAKGFGLQVERPYMQRTRALVELCHRHGIAVGGYVRYTTLMPETLKAAVPDCLERYAGRTGAGLYARYAQHYWRYIPCPCSQAWLDEYIEPVLDLAVNEAKLDLIAMDGTTLWPEPEACHCPRCHAAFVEYLAAKYPTPRERAERFGFEDVRHIELPYYGLPGAARAPRAINDPVAQEWILFRCDRMTEIYRFIVEAVKRRRPEVWVQGNIKYEPGMNTAWAHSNDLWALHRVAGDAFFTEESNSPGLRADGAVLSYIATFKKARQFGRRVLCYNRAGPPTYGDLRDPEELARSYAHQLAFNTDSLGCAITFDAGEFPFRLASYFDFHAAHRDLYASGEAVADVGVYYSTRSLALSFREPHLGLVQAQQALVHERIPFGYAFGEDSGALSRYRAVVLSSVECLSAAEIAALAAYVQRGGGLVLAGEAGSCDPWRRPQRDDRLGQALGVARPPDGEGRAEAGGGRVAWLEALCPEAGPREGGRRGAARGEEWVEEFVRGSGLAEEAWRSPRQAKRLIAALRWAGRGFSFEVSAPRGVVCEYVRQPELRRTLVHLVNFDLARDAEGIEIRCRRPGTAPRVTTFSPDEGGGSAEARDDGARLAVTLERLHRYAVVVLEDGGVLAPSV